MFPFSSFFIGFSSKRIFVDLAVLHNQRKGLFWLRQDRNVLERVAVDEQQIRIGTFLDYTELAGIGVTGPRHGEQLGPVGGRLTKDLCRRKPIGTKLEFIVDTRQRFGVGDDIRAEGDLGVADLLREREHVVDAGIGLPMLVDLVLGVSSRDEGVDNDLGREPDVLIFHVTERLLVSQVGMLDILHAIVDSPPNPIVVIDMGRDIGVPVRAACTAARISSGVNSATSRGSA